MVRRRPGASLTAEYGEQVPGTKGAARRFVTRTAAAVQSATASRRFRITVSESEAMSALSLGLIMPELMPAIVDSARGWFWSAC